MQEKIYNICDAFFFLGKRRVGKYSILAEETPYGGFYVTINVEDPSSLLDNKGKGVRRLSNCLSVLINKPVNVCIKYRKKSEEQ